MIDDTKRAIARYEVELPDEYVRESGKLAELERTYGDLRIEIQDLESLIRERTTENSRRDLNRLDRLAISTDLEQFGRQRASRIKRRNGLGVEILAKKVILVDLEKEQLAVKALIKDYVQNAPKLLDRAFWAADPTGSFSNDQYDQIRSAG